MEAAEAGLIGIAATNAPKSMAVVGGREPLIGTNPLSFALPRADGSPAVLDMATSVVVRGKIVELAKRGGSIAEQGVILPFSGGKGSGLAIMVEALCGILSGGLFGPQINNLYSDFVNPQGVGHLFLAIDPAVIGEGGQFETRVDIFAGMIKASLKAAGVEEILLPGEPETRLEQRIRADGIELPPNVITDLNETAAKLGVPAL